MLEKKTVSQCVSADYCRGWNDAVDAIPRWISVEERLPEDMEDVLVKVCAIIDIGYYDERGKCWEMYGYEGDCNPTHWMPLPEPPEVTKP